MSKFLKQWQIDLLNEPSFKPEWDVFVSEGSITPIYGPELKTLCPFETATLAAKLITDRYGVPAKTWKEHDFTPDESPPSWHDVDPWTHKYSTCTWKHFVSELAYHIRVQLEIPKAQRHVQQKRLRAEIIEFLKEKKFTGKAVLPKQDNEDRVINEIVNMILALTPKQRAKFNVAYRRDVSFSSESVEKPSSMDPQLELCSYETAMRLSNDIAGLYKMPPIRWSKESFFPRTDYEPSADPLVDWYNRYKFCTWQYLIYQLNAIVQKIANVKMGDFLIQIRNLSPDENVWKSKKIGSYRVYIDEKYTFSWRIIDDKQVGFIETDEERGLALAKKIMGKKS